MGAEVSRGCGPGEGKVSWVDVVIPVDMERVAGIATRQAFPGMVTVVVKTALGMNR